MRTCLPLFLTLCLLVLGACRSPSGVTPSERRNDVRATRVTVLEQLYESTPDAEAAIDGAAGYAVFSNFGLKIFVAGSGNGYGIAVNKRTGEETFMKMFQLEGGLGFGAKTFSAVFYFDDEEALSGFVESGWEFGADAELTAKHEEQGGSLEGATTVGPGVHLYQLTATGLSAQISLGGTKFWVDDELDKGRP